MNGCVLVIGASGIVGQHLRLTQPPELRAVYTSRDNGCPNDFGLKLETVEDITELLDRWVPGVIVNLAGENRPDVVERDWSSTAFINIIAPGVMAQWCRSRSKRMIHVSTQGVFGGRLPPYRADIPGYDDPPVNLYGQQKLTAERHVLHFGGEIARLTFILGVRPLPHVGRANPLESMLAAISSQMQVEDRFFSPCYAMDAATELWRLVQEFPVEGRIVHIGIPIGISRAQIAEEVIERVRPKTYSRSGSSYDELTRVKHTDAFPLPKWAPRPMDTTFANDARHTSNFTDGLTDCIRSWRTLLDYMDPEDRAVELALFFGTNTEQALAKLARGFGQAHQDVTLDFNRVGVVTDEDLLEWYRRTPTYVWELTAYHLDAGFNYMGMCEGIVTHLTARNRRRVLCLGDGIGDLSMRCADAGLSPIYNDLKGSKTAEFAMFRMQRRYGRVLDTCLTDGWAPEGFEANSVDAIIALDFFEHVTEVETWVRRCYEILRPGGLFLGQNAFGIGNEPGGSLPMHLQRNDRYVSEWDPLMDGIGYVRTGEGNWRRKP